MHLRVNKTWGLSSDRNKTTETITVLSSVTGLWLHEAKEETETDVETRVKHKNREVYKV